jgi:hypothetical protein
MPGRRPQREEIVMRVPIVIMVLFGFFSVSAHSVAIN